MDRSRIIIALTLALSVLAVVIGTVSIGLASRHQEFQSPTESFFSSGRAGIALVELHGVINDGRGGPGQPGADRIVARLKEAEESSSIRAVIIAINSPGGAVGATKKIYNAVRQLRKKKPVVAVISDIAASGGYYVASACDRIFAYEGSLIGSIGVIGFHPNVSGFLNQHGVTVTPLKAGRFKDSSYPFRDLTPEERDMVQRTLDDAYLQFLNDVKEGRGQSLDTVRRWAEGRIVSGKQAEIDQMITDLGGREEAVTAIKLILKTDRELPILEPERGFWEEIMAGGLGNQARAIEDAHFLWSGRLFYIYPMGLPSELMRSIESAGR